ncbi:MULTISPECIES: sensor histidine kinase [unclassified Sphingomonas]|uniref:sensor histidine kinase n=1 Tax=unclassified Sphingomonas TaxID=196159 RepID=UPI000836912E|nr:MULTISPECIES: ATP-binding protein [unclassified Sphingomonas]
MNIASPAMEIAIARLDRDGALLEADTRLAALNQRAGGAVGQPLAVPQLATIVRLAGRLGIGISRIVVAADGDDDLELMVRAEPDGDGVRLEVGGWHVQRGWRAPTLDADRDRDFLRADADWLWETDAALRLVHLSSQAAFRHGFDPASLLGQPLTRLFALVDNGEGAFPILAAVAAQSRFEGQEARLRLTGEPVVLAATPRIDPGGRFAGFAGAARIVTPDVVDPPADDADPDHATLPPQFGARLDKALRGPLARIIANADSIAAQFEGPLSSDYVDYASDIANAGRHLLTLIEDLVDLQAIERPDFTVSLEAIDLADLARRAAGLLSVRAAEAQVRIDRPDADEQLAATGDFHRVLQILVNLIGNAVRYSPTGGMVWLRIERDGDRACVIVADQGKGIAPEDHERIFSKFERLDPTEPGGSGLGLYIARALARSMGGDILVDSAPGQGARFVLTLPAR